MMQKYPIRQIHTTHGWRRCGRGHGAWEREWSNSILIRTVIYSGITLWAPGVLCFHKRDIPCFSSVYEGPNNQPLSWSIRTSLQLLLPMKWGERRTAITDLPDNNMQANRNALAREGYGHYVRLLGLLISWGFQFTHQRWTGEQQIHVHNNFCKAVWSSSSIFVHSAMLPVLQFGVIFFREKPVVWRTKEYR